MSWMNPKTELLIDYLTFTQRWEPSYIRQRMLPMLSTLFLREIASNSSCNLLCGQYEFHSVHRVKVRFGHQVYVVKWKKAAGDAVFTPSKEPDPNPDIEEPEESVVDHLFDEPDVPQVHIENGCCFLLTDEDMELVRNAFPEKVDEFLKEKVMNDKSLHVLYISIDFNIIIGCLNV